MVVFGFILLTTSNGGMYAEHLHLRAAVGSSKISSENPPRGFEGWRAPPLERRRRDPVLFTKGADNADFVVVGHSTDLGKDKFFLASLHKQDPRRAGGNGTSWHRFEDKLMGKAALLQMTGNPVVMFADTTDVMFSCSEGEILDRFDATDASSSAASLSSGPRSTPTLTWDERDFIERNLAKMDPEMVCCGATKTPDLPIPTEQVGQRWGGWGGGTTSSLVSRVAPRHRSQTRARLRVQEKAHKMSMDVQGTHRRRGFLRRSDASTGT